MANELTAEESSRENEPNTGKQPGAFAQDAAELLPSLTIIGILLVLARIHHRLIWGNLLGGTFLPAKPLTVPAVWAGIAILADLLILFTLLLAAVVLYMITNPCDVFANVVIPNGFSFLRPTMESLCPERLLQEAVQP